MNIRQNKYRANRIAGMSQYNAAKVAGYSENYSKSHAHKIEKVVNVGILNALEQAGLTETYQASELYKLTQATKPQVCDIYVQKDKNSKWKINENMNQFIETKDNTVCLRALEHLSHLKNQIKGTPLIDQSIHLTKIGDDARPKDLIEAINQRVSKNFNGKS